MVAQSQGAFRDRVAVRAQRRVWGAAVLALAAGLAGCTLPGTGGPRPAEPVARAQAAADEAPRPAAATSPAEASDCDACVRQLADISRALGRMHADWSSQLEALQLSFEQAEERLRAIEARLDRYHFMAQGSGVAGAAGGAAGTVPAGTDPSPAGGWPADPGDLSGVVLLDSLAAESGMTAPAPAAGGEAVGGQRADGAGQPAGQARGPHPGATGAAALAEPDDYGRQLYQVAYNDLMQDNYQLALINLRAFLERYPQSTLSDNAQYWIGEVYYGQRQFERAIEAFRRVIEDFPGGDKVPAAYYKIALAFINLREKATARRYLRYLIEHYPEAREARLAEATLGDL